VPIHPRRHEETGRQADDYDDDNDADDDDDDDRRAMYITYTNIRPLKLQKRKVVNYANDTL